MNKGLDIRTKTTVFRLPYTCTPNKKKVSAESYSAEDRWGKEKSKCA